MLHSCCSIFTRCQTHPIKRGRRQRTLTVLMLRAWFTTQRHTDEKLFTPFIPQNSSFLSRLLLLLLLVLFLSKALWQSCYPVMHYFNLGLSKQLTANSLLTLAKTEISLVIYIPWTFLLTLSSLVCNKARCQSTWCCLLCWWGRINLLWSECMMLKCFSEWFKIYGTRWYEVFRQWLWSVNIAFKTKYFSSVKKVICHFKSKSNLTLKVQNKGTEYLAQNNL